MLRRRAVGVHTRNPAGLKVDIADDIPSAVRRKWQGYLVEICGVMKRSLPDWQEEYEFQRNKV